MMGRSAVNQARMHVGARSLREAAEKILHKFGLKLSHARRGKLAVANAVRPAAEIDRDRSQRLVHGH